MVQRIMYYVLSIKRFWLLFLPIILATYFLLQTPSPAYAACNLAVESVKPVNERSTDCPAGLDQFEFIFKKVISVIVGLGFIAMLIMLIRAGIGYLTSGGEPKAIQQAHFTITWALLGIFFMAIAWLILQLIYSFTGIDVRIFDIRSLCEIGGVQFCGTPPPP